MGDWQVEIRRRLMSILAAFKIKKRIEGVQCNFKAHCQFMDNDEKK
jgi:hypothetical protein